MTETWAKILDLVQRGNVRISEHGYDELAADGIAVRDVMGGIQEALVLQNYPGYPKGPCVLVLQKDSEGRPIHAVWGIPRGQSSPAVLVTAYRPDQERWMDDFRRRRP